MKSKTRTKFGSNLFAAVALTLGLFAAAPLRANVVNINVASIATYGEQGNSGNAILDFDIGTGAHVTGIGYNVNLTAFAPSYLSEITILFSPSDSTLPGVSLAPAFDQDASGTGTFSSNGIVDLTAPGLDFNVSSDGLLRLEFFESYSDTGVDPNGLFNSGTLNVQYEAVPEPSTWAILSLSVMGTGIMCLRRRQAV